MNSKLYNHATQCFLSSVLDHAVSLLSDTSSPVLSLVWSVYQCHHKMFMLPKVQGLLKRQELLAQAKVPQQFALPRIHLFRAKRMRYISISLYPLLRFVLTLRFNTSTSPSLSNIPRHSCHHSWTTSSSDHAGHFLPFFFPLYPLLYPPLPPLPSLPTDSL